MLIGIFFIWLFAAIIVAFFDIKKSLGMMISYLLLVPYSSFLFSSIQIEFNYILFVIFGIFLFKETLLNNNETFDFTIVKHISIFLFFILLSSLFTDGVDFGFQLSTLRSFAFGNFLIPIMLWQVCKTKNEIIFFIKIILICLLIMLAYGIYCFITGQNPYITLLSQLFNKQDNFQIFSGIERGGIIGKGQSTTSHPMLWSVILSMAFFASYIFWNKKKNLTYYIFVLMILFNLFVCNVRTGIVASVIGVALLFTHFSLRAKLISILVIVFVLLLSIDSSIFGSYQSYVDSIIYFNDPDKNIGGSSIDMRLLQLGGAVSLWEQGGIIFGNGFGWCVNYLTLYGDHPILLSFESIIYVVLIENGVLGILIYGFFFYGFFRINRDLSLRSQNERKLEYWLINSYIITYIIYVVLTGIFGFNLFLIFLILMFIKIRLSNNNNETESIIL